MPYPPKICPFSGSPCKGDSCALFIANSPVSPYSCALKVLAVSVANPRELSTLSSVIAVTRK